MVASWAILLLLLLLLLLVSTATAVPNEYNRDIFGLIHSDANTPSPSTRETVPSPKTSATSTGSLAKPAASTSQSVSSQWIPSPTSQLNSTASATNAIPPTSGLATSADSQPTDHSSKTWQIVGIAIISVLFIATSITCAMFFDRLWRFLRDVVCCTSRPVTSEEFITDCDTQGWDTKTPSSSSSPPGLGNYKSESLAEEPSIYTPTRELPWNTDKQDWATLHRQPSRRNDHPPPA